MGRVFWRSLGVLAAGTAAACSGAVAAPRADVCGATQGSEASAQALAADNTAFALAFFPPAAGGDASNVVLSPYSVSAAMTMVDVGAAGETASQIEGVLHLPAGGAAQAPSYAALACTDETQGSADGNALYVANAVWAQKGLAFEPAFVDVLAHGYDAPLQQVDFEGDPGSAVSAVNAWVSGETHGQIPVLVGPSDVTSETRLVLVNAIYFKGAWASAFDPRMTASLPFTLTDGSQVSVPTMNGTIDARSSFDPTEVVLELAYKGGHLAMDFLMPTGGPGALSAFEAGLTPAALASALSGLGSSSSQVVYVPRFSFTTHVELRTVLQGLGMTDVFDQGVADLSGMDGARDLSVSAVVQQALVDVDESGTIAAAATAVSSCTCGGGAEPTMVHIDQPFVFLIRDLETGSVLFMGQVVHPGS